VQKLPMFRDAYRPRRCVVPVDDFFEWKAIKGKPKQPYAIAMRDGSPFGIGGLWENWKDPTSGEWIPIACAAPTAHDRSRFRALALFWTPADRARGCHCIHRHPKTCTGTDIGALMTVEEKYAGG
jgi:hypothetical protein